ncbi:DUF2867 domain-containing protein [Nocardia mexicana]|uniref:Uncharacterized protein DUF2867 n=1 Tax=Nocardia mexicana TaxID=279262 RepID=A0A370H5C1_9NOCA|nr:DUF2867 domain-containing protein [Nocardia mexicana]RDI51590.1 uncharacterized protein DUF2867 [Nocardia mexicana]
MTAQRARRVDVPRDAPESDIVAAADYASAFDVSASSSQRTPEQWARQVFEHAPAAMRGFLQLGWRLVLGLRLGPKSSPEHVLGWRIANRGANFVVLESHSRIMAAQNIVMTGDSTVTWATFVRFDRRIARPIWAAVKPFHHLAIPYLLGRAAPRELPSRLPE